VAVRDAGDLTERDPVLGESIVDRRHRRREHRVDLGVAEPYPVIEQEDAVPVDDGVCVGGPSVTLQQLLLVRWQPQLGDEERDHAHVIHGGNLPARRASARASISTDAGMCLSTTRLRGVRPGSRSCRASGLRDRCLASRQPAPRPWGPLGWRGPAKGFDPNSQGSSSPSKTGRSGLGHATGRRPGGGDILD
jgi:hypothetical protein